jgi:hypothetical protein
MKRPEDVQLSREEGEALLARLETNTLTAEDRQGVCLPNCEPTQLDRGPWGR